MTWQCLWCRLWVPWSNGAGDDMPEVCDECWSVAHGLREEAPTSTPTSPPAAGRGK